MTKLEKIDQLNIKKTKELVERELAGLSLDLSRFPAERKGWERLKNKLDREALTLLYDISRARKNYHRLTMADVSSSSSEDDEYFYCDYSGPNGVARFAFKKTLGRTIRFDHVKMEIFEEVLSLF